MYVPSSVNSGICKKEGTDYQKPIISSQAKYRELFSVTGLSSNSVCSMAGSLVMKSTLCITKICMTVSL